MGWLGYNNKRRDADDIPSLRGSSSSSQDAEGERGIDFSFLSSLSSPFSKTTTGTQAVVWFQEMIPTSNDVRQLRPGQQTILGLVGAMSFVVGWKTGRHVMGSTKNLFHRFTKVSDVPSQYMGPNAPYLRGRVVSVSDGDTLRFYHTPTYFFHSSYLPTALSDSGKKAPKVSDVTLPIRICTIDTPETAKFGKPGQPFSTEARDYLARLVEQKMVQIQILETDQYGRAVAQVRYPPAWTFGFPFLHHYVDEQMLRAGLAEVYRGSGAVYGRRGKASYEALELAAKQAKRGQWSTDVRETAAEYKARTK